MSLSNSLRSAPLAKAAYLIIILIGTIAIFAYTEEYIIPFILALIVWFIIHELRENLQMVPYIRKNWPLWLQSMIGFIIINAVILVIVELFLISMSNLVSSAEIYEANMDAILIQINEMAGMDITSEIYESLEKIDLTSIASVLVNYASSLIGDAFLILIYVLFLLIEESVFLDKLKVLYPSEAKQQKVIKFTQKMDHNISRYLTLKTLVSLLTGALSYVALLIFGVDAPIFWALLIFVLNYIPTIGSLIATLFPAVFAIVQFGELMPFVYVLLSVGLIQVVVGNIIEPKIMGNSLNISSLVVIIALTVWGAIWGIMGMILSVPITVMMIIVCEEIPSLRFIAVALSERGQIQPLEVGKSTAAVHESLM